MGKTSHALEALFQEAQTQEALDEAAFRRGTSELERQSLENILGSEGQEDIQNVDAADLPFTQRYSLDREYLTKSTQFSPYGGGTVAYSEGIRDQANDLMQQAADAARAGDYDLAEQLKDKAGNLVGTQSHIIQPGFNLGNLPVDAARIRAGSPSGQIVGELLRQSRAMLDPESKESMEFKRQYTEPAQRGISAERREAERGLRDLGLMRGAGRSAFAEAQVGRRIGEEFAGRRADVENQASQFFQTFSKQFATDAVTGARAWVEGTAGIRDAFHNAQDLLAIESAKYFAQAAERQWTTSEKRHDEAKARAAQYQKLAIVAGGVVLGALTGGIGAAALGMGAAAIGSAAAAGASAGASAGGAATG
jgi:hypothetical protein